MGTWKGQSTFNMCEVIKRENLNTKIYCVDTWLGSDGCWNTSREDFNLLIKNGYPQIYYQFLSNVVHNECQNIIIPVPCISHLGAKVLNTMNIKAELIYIDASHETEDVYRDIQAYWPLLANGGIMFGDDFSWPTVEKAVRQFSEETKNCFWTSEDGFSFWYFKK